MSAPLTNLARGTRCTLQCPHSHKADAVIVLASANGGSLFVDYVATIDGVDMGGSMALLYDTRTGVYRDLLTAVAVDVEVVR